MLVNPESKSAFAFTPLIFTCISEPNEFPVATTVANLLISFACDGLNQIKFLVLNFDCIVWQLNELVAHIELQCNTGKKKGKLDRKETETNGKLKVYYNPVVLGDNTILIEINGTQKVYLNHSNLNYIYIGDETFCRNTKESLQTVLRHSTLISEGGSKERNKYFNALRKGIM